MNYKSEHKVNGKLLVWAAVESFYVQLSLLLEDS